MDYITPDRGDMCVYTMLVTVSFNKLRVANQQHSPSESNRHQYLTHTELFRGAGYKHGSEPIISSTPAAARGL